MRNYIIKRVLISIVILIFVTFAIYLLMRCLPTSYVQTMAMQLSAGPNAKPYEEWLAQLNASYGLDLPIPIGWLKWLKEFCTGNFGDSWRYAVPVADKFKEVIGLSFVMGLLRLLFAVKLGWFETHGLVGRNFNQLSALGQLGDMAMHLVLPIVTLTIISIGGLMRYTRTNMLEVLNADYIRTARAKGLSEKKVIYHHAFRNTLIPLVTIVGGSLPSLFSGALITETLFSIPGIGFTSYTAMRAGDIPFTMFYLTFLAILTLAGNLLSDILYAVVDPRVRLA